MDFIYSVECKIVSAASYKLLKQDISSYYGKAMVGACCVRYEIVCRYKSMMESTTSKNLLRCAF
jgi:hypothetical protein